MAKAIVSPFLFIGAFCLCLGPWMSPPFALLTGILVAQSIGNPFIALNHKITRILLQASVVGLGFGMNVHMAIAAGKQGFFLTVISITGTLLAGWLVGRLLKTDKKSSWLITCGTAICGGSAIAAMTPVIRANEKQVSVAMGTVFLLNAVALFLFPLVGHWLQLSQLQFGLWSAIAIQDTSSVVGAAAKYGPEALQIGTTVKLARALWIIPVALLTAFVQNRKERKMDSQPDHEPKLTKRPPATIPWFIGFFIIALLANTYIPYIQPIGKSIVKLAGTGLMLTLFLIGAGLTRDAIRSAGPRSFLQGLLLWLILSAVGLIGATAGHH
ncbi:YeiH family protein [Flavitalea flava]